MHLVKRRALIPRLNQMSVIVVILTYSMAQQPLNSFDRPLMRVSSFNSILVTLIFC